MVEWMIELVLPQRMLMSLQKVLQLFFQLKKPPIMYLTLSYHEIYTFRNNMCGSVFNNCRKFVKTLLFQINGKNHFYIAILCIVYYD